MDEGDDVLNSVSSVVSSSSEVESEDGENIKELLSQQPMPTPATPQTKKTKSNRTDELEDDVRRPIRILLVASLMPSTGLTFAT